ncbi:hypothetical protein [Salmonella enterica]|uniref:Uncharacterized protein n=1 Tax=Salmonella enterica TaxID=28901 RepID=A0A701YZY8_SALER|nr:hypothetical protein [Salmonella enterica]HAC6567332.1 hypothetical protein [Salmonella enterica subsp. indica]
MMSDIHGSKLTTHGSSKFLFIGLLICSVIFIGFGIFCLTLMNMPTSKEEASGGIYFAVEPGGISPMVLFSLVGGGLIILGLIAAAIAFMQKNVPVFMITENGISCKYKGKETFSLFKDIADVYLFSVGRTSYKGTINSLAYRKNKSDAWTFISPRNSGYSKLISTFRSLYSQQRVKDLRAQLEQGATLEFNYVDAKMVWVKRAFSLNVAGAAKIDSSLRKFYLTKNSIIKDDKNITINKSDSINAGSWNDNLYLLDSDGNKKFSMMFPSIISADVFHELLQDVIERVEN